MELGPVDYRDVVYREKGSYPRPYVAYMTISCLHCADPACVVACPANTISKRAEDGIIVVDRELCLGKDNCGLFCQQACPYGMPRFGEEKNGKMQMCNLCPDKLAENKPPVCVAACPQRCLDAGPLDKLQAKYGRTQEAEGFTYSRVTRPSVIFKAKTK